MRNIICIGLLTVLFACSSKKSVVKEPLLEVINQALNFSVEQGKRMAESLEDVPGVVPRTINREGKLVTCKPDWWVSGFFPGQLWYLYEYSHDETLKKYAIEYTNRVENQKYTTDNHDVGFMIFCSFGNAYRITGDTTYLEVLYTAAKSLSTRYKPITGVIRSWDYASWSKQWQYPVIIDNMMNLELLTWSAKKFNDQPLMDIALSHADKTMQNHYRPDYSCYHVVSYDTLTGEIEKRHTSQGYSHESAWARGQAWGLYGFTMMYRETGKPEYLDLARNIAKFLINHPNMPDDYIPYWDFDYPEIPNTLRDASAASIMCSALIELSGYVENEEAESYLAVAEKQIRVLGSSEYLFKAGDGCNFLLKHSVGHFPNKSELNVPLTYADYYFVEALVRMRNRLSAHDN